MSTINHQFRLAARPVGLPKRSDWSLTEEPAPEPGDGEFLVKIQYISLDPARRGWMNEGRSYIAPVGIGEVMRAGAVGRVISSKHTGFAGGDHVYGNFGVQEYAVSKGDGVTKVDPSLAPLPVFLGSLGLPGMTAYFGLLDIGKPQSGQTVVVSGAAGAVGMVVGQIARIHGCRVVGIAGGAEKCRYLVAELGFDAGIDYKTEDVRKALRQQCTKGMDVYFDNVGGDILDAALANLARHARQLPDAGVCRLSGRTRDDHSRREQASAFYLKSPSGALSHSTELLAPGIYSPAGAGPGEADNAIEGRGSVNDNWGLEREAKSWGQKAFTRGRIVQGIHADDASGTSGGATAIGNSSNAAPTQLQRNRRR